MKSSIFNLPAMWNGNDKWWMALIHSGLRDFNYTLRPWQMGTTWEEENWGWVGSSSKYQKFIIPKIGIFLVFWICLLVFWTPLFWYFEHFGILSIFQADNGNCYFDCWLVFWSFVDILNTQHLPGLHVGLARRHPGNHAANLLYCSTICKKKLSKQHQSQGLSCQ